ncbi:MAG: NAD(P)H-hydrate dehydratase [Gammaproteobacteria bacterium]|nr:NAD(P)H-hydrate dehydratase [Gammaproteobacteria bacterium]MBT3723795.1 NAD(P)H-hydrate dehydratase [Gammaproteobacteria bacterium]MBT4077581.1 NAD(P)H-hydrate dehydratase [Gammaproteobacteria bacterium]MBT4448168.1 NAD(P)H-hydrate dehydratase [Gammaproteobacteria bacterium]MBT4859875.1 NAD(P)H-hydrate dehydratase [Gammaproteobacteria bacterium]
MDQLTMSEDGQSSEQLMGKASSAVWRSIQSRWPSIKHVVILAGCGNNGGDAFAVASLAKKSGVKVELITMGDLSMQSAESRLFRESWEQDDGVTHQWSGNCPDCDLIIDGLLGIGLSRGLNDTWSSMIKKINSKKAVRVSIDIPSGLNADTGMAMPVAIEADLTVTFIGRKIGLYLADGSDYCGDVVFDDLGLSAASVAQQAVNYQLLEQLNVKLPEPRKINSYKNQFGHVIVIGGGPTMSGAARLAGLAALRCGAGLVSLCVHPDNVTVAANDHAELMVSDWNALDDMLSLATVIVVGPGLGNSPRTKEMLQKIAAIDKPVVVDADALQPWFLNDLRSQNCVITPHPGEAARLLECSSQQIQKDRVASILKLNEHWPVVSVLKGAGSLVGQQHGVLKLCSHGHSGMATAGMGDVLSGLISAYLAQGLSPENAAQTAVLVHALAAEHYAKEHDSVSLIASDVIDRISLVVRDIRQAKRV